MLRDLEDRMRKSTKYSIRIPEVENRENREETLIEECFIEHERITQKTTSKTTTIIIINI
jgi:hypothetical protein